MIVAQTRFVIPAVALGLAAAAVAAPPRVLLVRPRMDSMGMYEKVELVIELEAEFDNPFDPEQIDVQVEFTAPSGKTRRVWGFFNPTTADSVWMARFAPTEVGVWSYVVHVRDRYGTASGEPGSFTVTPSTHHGFVKIAPNGRYLQYDDGTYEVRFYRTWTGEFLPSRTAECRAGGITITVPQWAQDGDLDTARGDCDTAFLLTPAAATVQKQNGPQ